MLSVSRSSPLNLVKRHLEPPLNSLPLGASPQTASFQIEPLEGSAMNFDVGIETERTGCPGPRHVSLGITKLLNNNSDASSLEFFICEAIEPSKLLEP